MTNFDKSVVAVGNMDWQRCVFPWAKWLFEASSLTEEPFQVLVSPCLEESHPRYTGWVSAPESASTRLIFPAYASRGQALLAFLAIKSRQRGRGKLTVVLNVRSSCWIFRSLQGCNDVALTVPDKRVLASRGKCKHHIHAHATRGGIIAALLPEPPRFCFLKSFLFKSLLVNIWLLRGPQFSLCLHYTSGFPHHLSPLSPMTSVYIKQTVQSKVWKAASLAARAESSFHPAAA